MRNEIHYATSGAALAARIALSQLMVEPPPSFAALPERARIETLVDARRDPARSSLIIIHHFRDRGIANTGFLFSLKTQTIIIKSFAV